MNSNDESSSPHSSSKMSETLETQPFLSDSFFVEEGVGFSGSHSPASFAFSPLPIPFSSSPVFEFQSGIPVGERNQTVPSSSTGGEAGALVTVTGTEFVEVPRPLECLQGNPIPPFLSKTYDLVDDPALDPIISWGSTGGSFVVWDPVEFSRIILPRNFKHNNFSSFVRQLNTYGFRKIDTDKWEFANEAFQRGKKHLLKSIQRRKSHQSQQQIGSYIGPSSEAGKSGLEDEVEKLRNEKSTLMQEVVELQQQQRGTVHFMEAVNKRIQSAEQRQKQMVSFFSKMLQNPSFIGRLKQKEPQKEISSSRTQRKFVTQKQHQIGEPDSSMEGKLVKYSPGWRDLGMPLEGRDLNPFHMEQGIGENAENLPFQFEDFIPDELILSDDITAMQGLSEMPDQIGEGAASSMQTGDHFFKGKGILSPKQELNPDYYVSFPEDLMKEKSFPELSSTGMESIIKQEDIWSMGLDTGAGMSSGGSDLLLATPVSYEMPELPLDIWDLGSLQVGGSELNKWSSADETPYIDPHSQSSQPKDNLPKNMDP
ncbi:heat stress transcription factor A-3 [Cannabis sativa]|uniref:heat stress transcription factor A-3 n=1 Tax=Cannabis sativa TaxID=3483 RepID=UPI0029CA781A|nr:heat stress transcription factor A-3 [Cannabis sativa]